MAQYLCEVLESEQKVSLLVEEEEEALLTFLPRIHWKTICESMTVRYNNGNLSLVILCLYRIG